MGNLIPIDHNHLQALKAVVQSSDRVNGFTHNFYKYPARFSPRFAKEIILQFSNVGDWIFDPFVGGGTSLVEASLNNRNSIGVDINPIATFVSSAKTQIIPQARIEESNDFLKNAILKISVHAKYLKEPIDDYYQKDVPWALRRVINRISEIIEPLPSPSLKQFLKCVLLRTSQWALDCKDYFPTVTEFKNMYFEFLSQATSGMREYEIALNQFTNNTPRSYCLNRSTIEIESDPLIRLLNFRPSLILTSPPYPGIHINYHQWQIKSRKRTAAPFWIINSLDGHGTSHYMFGHYHQKGLKRYFENAEAAFSSIRKIVSDDCMIFQLVGFSKKEKHFARYLEMMKAAGFEECVFDERVNGFAKRLWRIVPNRKWYADQRGKIYSGKEVLLIHKPK